MIKSVTPPAAPDVVKIGGPFRLSNAHGWHCDPTDEESAGSAARHPWVSSAIGGPNIFEDEHENEIDLLRISLSEGRNLVP